MRKIGIIIKAQLLLRVGSISINSAYYKRNNSYNANARKYRKDFIVSLNSGANIKELRKIRKAFNHKKHCLRINFQFYYPPDIILTKEGKISRKSKDIDNCLKLPMDFLCGSKYEKDAKYAKDMGLSKIENLGIDDQYVCELLASKRQSIDSTNYLVIEIEILNIKDVVNRQIDF